MNKNLNNEIENKFNNAKVELDKEYENHSKRVDAIIKKATKDKLIKTFGDLLFYLAEDVNDSIGINVWVNNKPLINESANDTNWYRVEMYDGSVDEAIEAGKTVKIEVLFHDDIYAFKDSRVVDNQEYNLKNWDLNSVFTDIVLNWEVAKEDAVKELVMKYQGTDKVYESDEMEYLKNVVFADKYDELLVEYVRMKYKMK